MKALYTSLSFLAAATGAGLALAEDAAILPGTVVTATRSVMPENQLDAATTVYTRKDIERLQAKSVQEVLRGSTGVDLVEQGGFGKNVSVFMRGTNSDHVLVLIDGIKAGSVTLGTTPFQFIPIDQVERIEIIRGPQSSKYGSEAIGGVIQIFTRKGSLKDGHHVDLETGGGSYDTYRSAGTVSGRVQNTWYTLGSSLMRSQGFNAYQAGGLLDFDQPDRDGYKNTGLNARLGHRFDNGAEMEAFYQRAEGQTKYDNGTYPGYDDDRTDFVEQTVGANANMNFTDNWRSSLRLGQSRDDQDNFSHGTGQFLNRFGSTRWNAIWLNEFTLSDDHQLQGGAEYLMDTVDSDTPFAGTTRYNVGVFGEYHGRWFDKHFINAAIRWDHNENFGDVPTGSIGWRYQLPQGFSLLANYGAAFKAPSFNNLYYPNYGNPNLKPEYSQSTEAGVAGDHGWGKWQVRAYHTDIKDLIVPVLVDPTFYIYQPQNVAKAQIEGIEAEIGTQIYGFNAKLTGDLLRTEDRSDNLRLPRRANKTLMFDLSRGFGKFNAGVTVLAQGDRYDNVQNTIRVPGFVTVNLSSAYHFNDNWEIRAKLNNLLDKNYQTSDHFWMPDRNFFISMHFRN